MRPLRARATLSDRIVVFGDTVRARVDVTLDLRQVDPSTVKVRVGFDPWRRVEPARVTRTDAGSSSHIRMTYVLRCLKQACVPERDTAPLRVRAGARRVPQPRRRARLAAGPFPALTVNTRIRPADLATAAPWRLDVTDVPEPSYRASPGLLLALLIAGSLVLLAGRRRAGLRRLAASPRRARAGARAGAGAAADAARAGARAARGRRARQRRGRPAALARARRRGARRARGGGRAGGGRPYARVVADGAGAGQDEEPRRTRARGARGGAAPARGGAPARGRGAPAPSGGGPCSD